MKRKFLSVDDWPKSLPQMWYTVYGSDYSSLRNSAWKGVTLKIGPDKNGAVWYLHGAGRVIKPENNWQDGRHPAAVQR